MLILFFVQRALLYWAQAELKNLRVKPGQLQAYRNCPPVPSQCDKRFIDLYIQDCKKQGYFQNHLWPQVVSNLKLSCFSAKELGI